MESSAFKEAFEEIRRLSMDPDTIDLAISREIALRDQLTRLEEAENRGVEKGSKAKTIELVLALYQKNTPLSFIAEVTKLSVQEVHSIIEKEK